jgi:helicase MOV-10
MFSFPTYSSNRVATSVLVVSTYGSAGVFSGVGMAHGHFTHIFIDEAGQATESESFLSIKMIADSKINVILSSDPKQLGPVIRSGIARELGLEISYLKRLMDRDVYDIRTGCGRR